MKKCRWSAYVEVCVARYTKFLEHRHSETSSGVKIEPQTILGPRPAVYGVAAASPQRLHEVAGFLSKWVVFSAASPVQPPHFPRRLLGRQCMKHGKHRRRSYACTQQDNGPLAGLKREIASRCAHVQYVTDPYMFMHVGTAQAIHFLLDAHAIAIGAWRVRERIASQHGRCIRIRPQAQHDELTRLRCDQRTSIRGLEHQRDDAAAFVVDPRDSERAKACPSGRRAPS